MDATIEFFANTSQVDLHAHLFELNSDTIYFGDVTPLPAVEATNRRGLYLIDCTPVTPPLIGVSHCHILDAAGYPVANGYVDLKNEGLVHRLERQFQAPVFWSRTEYHFDTANDQDEYRTIWFRDGTPLTSGVTNPAIWVVDDSSFDWIGTELSPELMTEIGSTHAFLYNAPRIARGTGFIVTTFATIESQIHRWRQPFGRDQ